MPDSAIRKALLLAFPAKIKSFCNNKNNMRQSQNYVISKWLDFICLGGIGILIIPIILSFTSYGETNILIHEVKAITFYIAIIINFPHFIHSYQLFHESYRNIDNDDKTQIKKFKQVLYLVPIIFFSIALIGLITSQEIYFNILISFMFLTVGWHYVKQGYGVLILSCNLNKVRLSNYERKILLTICYSVWLTAWGLNNAGASSPDSFGISGINIKLPDAVLFTLILVALSANFELLRVLIARRLSKQPNPNFIALSSFFVTIYVWMFFSNIAFYFLLIPAMHSLQYLAITYRAKKNQFNGSASNSNFRKFLYIGLVSGIVFFLLIPRSLDYIFGESYEDISITLFSLIIITFINIHHYFIDSVIWKKENKFLMGNLLQN